jgi:hypothetical protein
MLLPIADTGIIEIDGFKLGYRIESKGTPALVIGLFLF